MGRDPERYPNPERFDPTRWLTAGREVQSFDPYSFPVFQAGPRICLGKDLALYEAKILLAELIYRYQFRLPEDSMYHRLSKEDPIYQVGVTLSIRGDLELEVTAR